MLGRSVCVQASLYFVSVCVAASFCCAGLSRGVSLGTVNPTSSSTSKIVSSGGSWNSAKTNGSIRSQTGVIYTSRVPAMKIVSVDIGTRNFAFTVYNGAFTEFHLLDLGKMKDPVLRMKQIADEEPFASADIILVENQMRAIMKTMATALRCFHLDKVVRVQPQCVKRFFNTSKKKHHKNKKAGVEEAVKYLDARMLARFHTFKKKDDIADCILQTIWYVNK